MQQTDDKNSEPAGNEGLPQNRADKTQRNREKGRSGRGLGRGGGKGRRDGTGGGKGRGGGGKGGQCQKTG